jgi:hypothetical protein
MKVLSDLPAQASKVTEAYKLQVKNKAPFGKSSIMV